MESVKTDFDCIWTPYNLRILFIFKFFVWYSQNFYCDFWTILTHFWAKMDQTTLGANFFHKRNAREKFQLKISTLSKNNCSATWCPNCYRKKSSCGNLRNDYRYEKHVVIFRPTLLTVADLFKSTVRSWPNFDRTICSCCWSNWQIKKETPLWKKQLFEMYNFVL